MKREAMKKGGKYIEDGLEKPFRLITKMLANKMSND